MRRVRNAGSSFETDIAQEFRDVKRAIADSNAAVTERINQLTERISQQNRLFERELTKLNQNMESVLRTIADHENRLTQLEAKHIASESKEKTVGEMAKVGWFLAKFVLAAGVVIGGVLGTAKAWSLLFPGS